MKKNEYEDLAAKIDEALDLARLTQSTLIVHLLAMASLEMSRQIELANSSGQRRAIAEG